MHSQFNTVVFNSFLIQRRGARVVMEQIANLSTGDCRQGSSPCLSAIKLHSGCSVARSSRLVWDEEVAGSNPATPTLFS
ncbi:protein of unknown function [Tenacibaculum aestuariivivum]